MRTLAASGVLALGLVLAARTSEAAEPTILVLPYQAMGKGIAPELTEQTTVVVTEEMKAGGLNIVRADDGLGGGAPKQAKSSSQNRDAPVGDPKAGDKAKRLLNEADDALQDEEFADAIKKLEQAERLLLRNGDAVPDLRLLPETYLKLAVAYFRDGSEDEADESLNKAVHYDPDRELSNAEYPPIFIRSYDRARFNVLRRPRARIEVRAKQGSSVLFDGRNLGKTPLVLKDALPGNHWIRVEHAGEPPMVKKISLRSKRTILVEFGGEGGDAEPDAGDNDVFSALQKNQLQQGNVDQLRAAGKRNGADFVMAGSIYKTRTAYNIYTIYVRVKDGKVGRLVDVAFDLDMLSAQIEVYKLATDAKKQATGDIERPIDKKVFAMAPKVKLRAPRSRSTGGPQARLTTVAAAPPPIAQPNAPTFADRGPVEATEKPEARAETGLVPKDERTESDLTTSTVIPVDERDDDDEGSAWWIWVAAGVLAAGAGTAGILLATGGSADEAQLRITW